MVCFFKNLVPDGSNSGMQSCRGPVHLKSPPRPKPGCPSFLGPRARSYFSRPITSARRGERAAAGAGSYSAERKTKGPASLPCYLAPLILRHPCLRCARSLPARAPQPAATQSAAAAAAAGSDEPRRRGRLVGGGAMAGRRGMLRRKPNFTLQEIDILMSEVLKYEQLLFGAASTNVNAYEKQKIWWRITNKINAAGRNQRDIGEVKNRWRGLRRRANDKIARHRLQERQAQPPAERPHLTHLPGPGGGVGSGESPGQPELGPEWSLVHGACPLDTPPLPGTVEAAAAAALQGVKEEPVKDEPVDVKSEPFHPLPTETIQQRVTRGPERRLLRSSGHAPNDPCEGWSRSPPNSSQTELSISELGGQQEALGSDYASITFEQESPHGQLNGCNIGDVVAPGTVPIQEGLSEGSRFSLAQRRIVQSNEQLVQEVRAFRQEYAESRRETASILHSIAEALSGVRSSLSEIRDLYLCQQAVPKQ